MSPSSTPATMKASRSDLFSKYPRASSSSIRFLISMCHQLVSSHGPDGSRTRVWAPDLTHPRSAAVSCRRSAQVAPADPLFSGPRPPSFGPARAHYGHGDDHENCQAVPRPYANHSLRPERRSTASGQKTGSDQAGSSDHGDASPEPVGARAQHESKRSVHGHENHTQRGILRTFDTRLGTEDGSCGQDVGALWETPDGRGRPTGSDLKCHVNDRLSDRAQAGVV